MNNRIFSLAIMLLLMVSYAGSAFAQTAPDMLDNALPSVVTVAVYKAEATKKTFGYRGKADVAYQRVLDLSGAVSSGSGFIVEYGGKKYIITNAHVVATASEDRESIFAFTINQSRYEVKVKGGDSFYDLAVLEFVTEPGKEVTTVKFTNDETRIGEPVYAIGNPLGEYPYSVTSGIISAKNRVRDGATGKYGFLQSTATIIWGNSGGPLVNAKGDVVGVNSQIAFTENGGQTFLQQQINFALEAPVCKRIVNDILTNNGRVRRAYVGVEISQKYTQTGYDAAGKASWELTDKLPVISGVLENSPAAKILRSRVGATITKINNHEVRSIEEALGELESAKPGINVDFTLDREGNSEKVSVPTVELEPTRLQELTSYLMEKDPSINLVSSNNSVVINYKQAYQQHYERNFGRPYQQQSQTEQWTIVGVGMSSDKDVDLWRVNSLSDLGAGLRFCGLQGFYDLYVVPSNAPNSKAQKTRIYFSGSEQIIKRDLWY